MEKVVFCKIDGVNKPGSADAHKYGVWGYPSFVVTDAGGEVIDRWVGYDGNSPSEWIGSLDGALADPTPVVAKEARFAARPDGATARTLGRIALSGGAYRKAVGYYRQAQALEPARAGEADYPIFEAMAMGARGKVKAFAFADARAAADAVLGGAPKDDQVIEMAFDLRAIASGRSERRALAPYLEAALRATDGRDDPRARRIHADLAVTHALYIEGDKAKALELKRGALPEKWQEDPDALNRFAWWCFDVGVNLEEAEALARKGVELATADDQKAELLDTAAAICGARGNAREAVRLEKQAVALQPDREEFRQQLARLRQASAGGS